MNEETIAKKNNKRNKFLLILGKETSRFGNILFDYANSILIVDMFKTNAFLLAIYQSSEMIISMVVSLLGGVFADQGKKKKIIVIRCIKCLSLHFSCSICEVTDICYYNCYRKYIARNIAFL